MMSDPLLLARLRAHDLDRELHASLVLDRDPVLRSARLRLARLFRRPRDARAPALLR